MQDFIGKFYEVAENPNWAQFDSERKHIHDWRTYVNGEVRASWWDIPLIGRCAVIACCEEMAGREEWD